MFPILYDKITIGVIPQDHGLGVLSDCISCEVEQKRNDIYELVIEYPASGIHAKEISWMRFLKVKPNFTDNPQLFYIDRVGKTMKGKFTVYCKHISYLMSGFEILSGSANNIGSACALLEDATCVDPVNHPDEKFTIGTLRQTSGNFEIKAPSSVKSWFVGKEGSLLDVYGGSDIVYNNFSVNFRALEPATDRGVVIRYKKNLLELSQEMDCSNLYTHVRCFWKKEDVVKYSSKIATGLTLEVQRVLILDATSTYETEPTEAELDLYAANYISGHNLTVPENNIKLDFVQIGELKDRVDLFDKVTIYYEALGINTKAKCISTKWDCLKERYIETEFGDIRQDLSDTMAKNNAAIGSAISSAEAAESSAKSKARTFLTPPIPPYDKGDLWVFNGTVYACNISRPARYVNYLGATTTPIGEGSTTSSIVIGEDTVTAQTGDVVFYDDGSDDTSDYYIWNGTKWTDYPTHLIGGDWILATNFVNEDRLEKRIKESSEIITGNKGGFIILHDSDNDGNPDELLIVNYPDINDPRCNRVWRWNLGGLGFATSYASDKYYMALTIDPDTGLGAFNADLITVGRLDADKIDVSNLTADMFKGGEINIGGVIDQANNRRYDGVLKIFDRNGVEMGVFDKDGIRIYGEGSGNNRAYVLFDSNGMAGYDTAGTKIFWTNKQEFHMKKAVVEEEISCFGIGKFVRLTIYDQNDNVTDDGIALVSI